MDKLCVVFGVHNDGEGSLLGPNLTIFNYNDQIISIWVCRNKSKNYFSCLKK